MAIRKRSELLRRAVGCSEGCKSKEESAAMEIGLFVPSPRPWEGFKIARRGLTFETGPGPPRAVPDSVNLQFG